MILTSKNHYIRCPMYTDSRPAYGCLNEGCPYCKDLVNDPYGEYLVACKYTDSDAMIPPRNLCTERVCRGRACDQYTPAISCTVDTTLYSHKCNAMSTVRVGQQGCIACHLARPENGGVCALTGRRVWV